jgi:hypothetical protein
MCIHNRDMESGIQHLEIASGLKESSLERRDDTLTCKVINLLDQYYYHHLKLGCNQLL